MAIRDDDLAAYAAGRLSLGRRREVEGYLAANPDLAAQVMTQMHLGRNRRPLQRRERLVAGVLGLAVVACVVSAFGGWMAAEQFERDGWREIDGGLPPDFVEDSADSREAIRLRGQMISQVASPRLDASDIHQRLKLPIPRMPAQWQIRDVQVFPSDDGPCVNLVLDTNRGPMELFAVRWSATNTDVRPEIARRGREKVAFWRRGDAAYVLSGPQSSGELLAEAFALARSANL